MSDVSISVLVIGITLCLVLSIIVYLMVKEGSKQKKAFADLKVGDIYVNRRDSKNPFLNSRRYVCITKKSDAYCVPWVEYKSLFGRVTDDMKWEDFYGFYEKESRTEEEIKKSIEEYERGEK